MSNSLLIKSVQINDLQSPFHQKTVDILIENSKIANIGDNISTNDVEIFDASGHSLSRGWFDVFANCPDPGEPWKESTESLSAAAINGGFTYVASLCGSNPLPDNATVIQQIKNQTASLPINIMPIGSSSERIEGKEMAEVYEMHLAGAVAQTDGMVGSASPSLRSKLMQYCASLNIPYLHFPFDSKLVTGGCVHEGFMHVNLGLKGLPTASETMSLLSDIELAKWLGTPLRILGISSSESLEIVKNAKKSGMDIKVAVPIMNLVYNESALEDFDENYKVLPPLRTEQDRQALVQGVIDGTIDAICSNHQPSDIESKNVEFEYAHFGTATLPFFFPLLMEAFNEEHLPKAIQVLTTGASSFLNLVGSTLEVGQEANFTIFNLNDHTNLDNKNKGSLAYNVLGLNQSAKGRIVAVYTKGRLSKSKI